MTKKIRLFDRSTDEFLGEYEVYGVSYIDWLIAAERLASEHNARYEMC